MLAIHCIIFWSQYYDNMNPKKAKWTTGENAIFSTPWGKVDNLVRLLCHFPVLPPQTFLTEEAKGTTGVGCIELCRVAFFQRLRSLLLNGVFYPTMVLCPQVGLNFFLAIVLTFLLTVPPRIHGCIQTQGCLFSIFPFLDPLLILSP